MIIEAFKIVSSVFPFIKEAFLWRDGAEADKPVTEADLRKRKIAVFVLFASLVINYLAFSKLYEMHTAEDQAGIETKALKDKNVALAARVGVLETERTSMVPMQSCMSPRDVFDQVNKQVDAEIQAGILIHTPVRHAGKSR